MTWPLYLALKQLFPTGRRVPFFTVISLLGVALGVMVLIVTLSVMGGFGQQIRKMIVDTSGDVQISASQPMANAADVMALARKIPGVVGATPHAEGVVMVLSGNKPAFPAVQGVDLGHVEEVLPLNSYLQLGSIEDLDDDSVILSVELARSLGASLGSRIELYTPLMLEKMRHDEVLLPREFRVAGLFEIGHTQLDSSLVICTLRTMQDLYGLGSSVHGVSLRLAPGADPDEVAAALNARLPRGQRALTWMESSRDFLFILQLEKNMLFFLLLFIVVVAGFSVASSLLISVVRKTREIGLLAALGGDARGVAACYCYQGLFIGLVGTALGVVLGFTAVHFRNDAVHAFTRLTQSEAALQRFYMFTEIPAHLVWTDLVMIVLSSIAIALVAAVLPAWRAARLKPSEALRSE
ncbi:MAG TPA: ABC transporter permease [Opitutaceae bacterium]|nr:ABC transporter permease [Opitutaceae bacterium]